MTSTLSAIYDAAVEPAQWPVALAQLSRLFRAGFADKFARTHDRSSFAGVAVGLDASDYQEQFLGTWAKRNVWGQKRPVKLAGEIVTTREILPREELVRSEMYSDYLHARGLHEGMRLAVWSGRGGIEDISLLRPWSMGLYTEAERGLAQSLMPHLRRSADVSRRLARAEVASLAGTEALERLGYAVVLLDAAGRVVFANRVALAKLGEADGLSASAAGLVAASLAANRALWGAVQAAVGVGRLGRSGSVRVPRPSGRPDLAVSVIPLQHEWRWMAPERPAVLVFIVDPAVEPGRLRAQLRQSFGLTNAEAAVAEGLLGGETLGEIAERSGRSVHTLRTHLARLMAKTGVSRQAELVRVLLSLPRFRME